MEKVKLSICVITMNRAEQLSNALSSCSNCSLPNGTEFVIVDNASTDNTKQVVNDFFENNPFPYIYEYETENLGVGGGRNRVFELSKGEYVYFLDDDAVMAPQNYEDFFMKPLSAFEKDPKIAIITTNIYDEMLSIYRWIPVSKKESTDGILNSFTYHGGSHFLRSKYFSSPLYLDFKYGMEELVPSIVCMDKGFRVCYMKDILLLHQPKVDKWKKGSNSKLAMASDYAANVLISKRMLYPSWTYPILYLFFVCRVFNYFKLNMTMWRKTIDAYQKRKQLMVGFSKIKSVTILKLMRDYRWGTVF